MLVSIVGGNLTFWKVDLSKAEAAGESAGFYISMADEPASPRNILNSLLRRGNFPTEIYTLIHEVTHNKQGKGIFLELLALGDMRVETALKESHARYAENDPRNGVIDIIDSIGGDDLQGRKYVQRRGRMYNVRPDQLIESAYVCERLYALGYSNIEVARIIRRDRWDDKSNRFVNIEKVIANKREELGLTEDDLDNLVTALKLESDIERNRVQIIANEELKKVVEETFKSETKPFNLEVQVTNIDTSSIKVIDKISALKVPEVIQPDDLEITIDPLKYEQEYLDLVKGIYSKIQNLRILNKKFEETKKIFEILQKRMSSESVTKDEYIKEAMTILMTQKDILRNLSPLAMNMTLSLSKVSAIYEQSSQLQINSLQSLGLKNMKELEIELQNLKRKNLFNRNKEKIEKFERVAAIFVPPDFEFSDIAHDIRDLFNNSNKKLKAVDDFNRTVTLVANSTLENISKEREQELKEFETIKPVDGELKTELLNEFIKYYLSGENRIFLPFISQINQYITNKDRSTSLDLEKFSGELATLAGADNYKTSRMMQDLISKFNVGYGNEFVYSSNMLGSSQGAMSQFNFIDIYNWFITNQAYIAKALIIQPELTDYSKKYSKFDTYTSTSSRLSNDLQKFVKLIKENFDINFLYALEENSTLKKFYGENLNKIIQLLSEEQLYEQLKEAS